MASLAPPSYNNRHRASSTNIRPALTLNTLSGRRRSNSDLQPPSSSSRTHSPLPSPIDAMHPTVLPPADIALGVPLSQSPKAAAAAPSFVELYNRVMHLLRVAQKESSAYVSAHVPTPSTPRISLSRSSISTEETLLPLSSPSVATFAEAYSEKPSQPPQPSPSSSSWWHGSPSVHTPVFFVIAAFPLSTALLLFCMATLPITQAWPRNITDLAQLGRELHGYSQSGTWPLLHVVGVLSVVVAWNHAWSIPGSVLWNVLAGALFSPLYATLLLTALTTVGSIFASLLAAPLAPFLVRLLPRAMEMTRNAIEGSSSSSPSKPSSSAWVRLSILRLIGIVPWSGINVACGVCGVALYDCVLGSFIGSLPWTAVTCQIGDILQTVASTPTSGVGAARVRTVQELLTSPEIVAKLVALTVLSLAPILGRERLRQWVSGRIAAEEERGDAEDGESDTVVDGEEEKERGMVSEERGRGRWAWVREWREKIRVPSRSRAREAFKRELEVLVREKEQGLPL